MDRRHHIEEGMRSGTRRFWNLDIGEEHVGRVLMSLTPKTKPAYYLSWAANPQAHKPNR